MTVWIGTSGWQYRDWRGRFYPAAMPTKRWLEFYAGAFATVESNNAFYNLPERRVFESWAERTPEDFVMAVKVSRYLTHIKRLGEPKEPVARFVNRVRGLASKVGPVLIQLPPTFRCNIERLRDTLDQFPADFRVAVEFRHDSWYVDDVRALLTERGAALCLADRRGPLTPLWRTTDWTYLRFHEGRSAPLPCYGRRALETWAKKLAGTWSPSEDAWVYFNNDPRGCAPRDAAQFAAAIAAAGLQPTRVPPTASISVG